MTTDLIMSDSEERVEDSAEEEGPMEAEAMDEDDLVVEKLPAYVPGPAAVDITPNQDGGVMKVLPKIHRNYFTAYRIMQFLTLKRRS